VKATEPTYKQALAIGTFQSLSVVPGVSRAAATIIGGLLTGLDRESATEFSFLLAVPTMFAATALDIYKSRAMIVQGGVITLFVGTVLSFLFAILQSSSWSTILRNTILQLLESTVLFSPFSFGFLSIKKQPPHLAEVVCLPILFAAEYSIGKYLSVQD